MESVKCKTGKKNFILKTWERCRSIPKSSSRPTANPTLPKRSKSWNSGTKDNKTKSQVAPEGCLWVYVGPEKQRFVVKTKHANHPLFRLLLEDAESEYGYNSDGPILLTCDVDLFYKVLAEMESGGKEIGPPGCGFAYGSSSPFNPSRRLGNTDMAKGYSSYGRLTPSRLIKMN